jgi:hypothetical protein
MAITKGSKTTGSKSEIKPADGWCNVSVKDANDKLHRVGKSGIALFNDDRVGRSLLNKLKAAQLAAQAGNTEIPTSITVTLTATISLAVKEDESDLDLVL